MGGQSISKGALTLTTDAQAMQSGLQRAQQSINQFGGSLKNIELFSGGAFGLDIFDRLKGSIEGIFETIKKAGDEAETTLANAMAFGTTAEELQKLSGAAQLAGVDTEQFSNILRVAADTAGDAAKGGEDIAKKLQAIGLATADIAGQNAPDALNIMLTALKGISKESDRIKAIDDLFGGKRALQIVKLLNADMGELVGQVEQLGTVLSEDQLKKLDDFADKVQMAQNRFASFGKKALVIASDVVGAFEEFFSGKDWTVLNPKETAAERAAADQNHWDMVSREMDAMERIAAQRKEAQKAEFIRNEDLMKAKALQQYIEEIVSASNAVLKSSPMEQFTKTIEGLDYQMQFGQITADQYDKALLRIAESMGALNSAGENLRLPSAIMAGSQEAARSRIADTAESRFGRGDNNPIVAAINDMKMQEKMQQQQVIKAIEKVVENTRPLVELDGI